MGIQFHHKDYNQKRKYVKDLNNDQKDPIFDFLIIAFTFQKASTLQVSFGM